MPQLERRQSCNLKLLRVCQPFWAHAYLDFARNQEHKFGQAVSNLNRNSARNMTQIQSKLATVYSDSNPVPKEIGPLILWHNHSLVVFG